MMINGSGGSSGDESDVETEPGLTLKRKVSHGNDFMMIIMMIMIIIIVIMMMLIINGTERAHTQEKGLLFNIYDNDNHFTPKSL